MFPLASRSACKTNPDRFLAWIGSTALLDLTDLNRSFSMSRLQMFS
jgi:hypothetical protein